MATAYRSNPDAGAGQDLAHLGPLHGTGMLLRALDAEVARRADPALKTAGRDRRPLRPLARRR